MSCPGFDKDTQSASNHEIPRPGQLSTLVVINYHEICRYLDSQSKCFAFPSTQLDRPFNEKLWCSLRSSENLSGDQLLNLGRFTIRFNSNLV